MEPLQNTIPIYDPLVQQAQPIQTGPENFVVQGTEQLPKKKCACTKFFAKKNAHENLAANLPLLAAC